MKILQIIQKPQRRGAEIFACQLSEALQEAGHEVDIVFLFDNEIFELDFSLNFIPLGGNPKKRFTDFGAYRRLARLISDGEYDVVQANAGDTLKYAAFSRFLFRWSAPLVFRNANKMSAFIRGSVHKRLNRWLLAQCRYYISVSENCRQDLIGLYAPANNRSETITIGTFRFDEVTPVKKTDFPVLINIGSLVPEKNQVFLLDILQQLRSTYPTARLWIFGEGRERKHLEEKITAKGLGESVTLWGNRPDVISHLKAADVMVMPSFIEGLPGVILEAMSCRVPVIAAPVGGIPEVVRDGETGYTPENYDAEQYAQTIVTCLENEKQRKVLTEAAFAQTESTYLLPVIAQSFLTCYQKIIRNG